MADSNLTVKYWIEGENEYPFYYTEHGVKTGWFADILDAVGKETGLATERITVANGEPIDAPTALEMLKMGDLDIVFGVPEALNTDAVKDRGIAEAGVYSDKMTALIRKDSPMISVDDTENCYWAIKSDYSDIIQGSGLADHTVDVNTTEELEAVLKSGEVYGILVPRSSVDYSVLIDKAFEYKEYEGIKYSFAKGIYTRDIRTKGTESGIPDELIKNIIEEEIRTNDSRRNPSDELAIYANTLAEVNAGAQLMTGLAIGGCSLMLVFGVLCAAFVSKLRRQKECEKAKLGAIMSGEPNKELCELNLKTNMLTAYENFKVFGDIGLQLDSTVRLDRLSDITGFDFCGHFAGGSMHGSNLYRNRMIIHLGGRKLYITEEGRRVGNTLIFVMTNVTDEVTNTKGG